MAFVTTTPVNGSTTFYPTLTLITGSQLQIPAGVRSASIAINSGYAYVNGVGPIIAGVTINFGGYNGSPLLASGINIGATGSAAAPCNALVVWEI